MCVPNLGDQGVRLCWDESSPSSATGGSKLSQRCTECAAIVELKDVQCVALPRAGISALMLPAWLHASRRVPPVQCTRQASANLYLYLGEQLLSRSTGGTPAWRAFRRCSRPRSKLEISQEQAHLGRAVFYLATQDRHLWICTLLTAFSQPAALGSAGRDISYAKQNCQATASW